MIFRKDSRDLHFHEHFGTITEFPLEYNVDRPAKDDVQPPGNVQCVVYSVIDCAEDFTGLKFDKETLWNAVPHYLTGTDPIAVIKEVCKNGLLPIQTGTIVDLSKRIKPFSSYYNAATGPLSIFDNIRSAVLLSGFSVIVWSDWFQEWQNAFDVCPIGKTKVSCHCTTIEGWCVRDGVTYFIIEAHIGRKILMSQDVIIDAFADGRMVVKSFSTKEIDKVRSKTIAEQITDTTNNLIELIKQLIGELNKKKIPMTNDDKIYNVAFSLIGKHCTCDLSVPKELGCGEAWSYIMKRAGYKLPVKGIAGTYECDEWLQQHATRLTEPHRGCTVVSPTIGDTHGHISIMGNNQLISNNSNTGKLDTQWNSLQDWLNYYTNELGLETKYYSLN